MREPKPPSLPCRPVLLRDLRLSVLIIGWLALIAALAGAPTNAADGSPDTIARDSVAQALGIDPAAIKVISSVPRDFPDASLGCPQPDMAYAQVITPGFQVLVEADGRRFDVRVAGTAGRICYRRKALTVPAGSDGHSPRQLAETARADLAERLALPPDAVTITGLRRLKPGEALQGCGEVCAEESATDCGVAVRLRTEDREFEYVAGQAGVRPCPEIASR